MTRSELEELEKFQHETGLRNEALRKAFASRPKPAEKLFHYSQVITQEEHRLGFKAILKWLRIHA